MTPDGPGCAAESTAAHPTALLNGRATPPGPTRTAIRTTTMEGLDR